MSNTTRFLIVLSLGMVLMLRFAETAGASPGSGSARPASTQRGGGRVSRNGNKVGWQQRQKNETKNGQSGLANLKQSTSMRSSRFQSGSPVQNEGFQKHSLKNTAPGSEAGSLVANRGSRTTSLRQSSPRLPQKSQFSNGRQARSAEIQKGIVQNSRITTSIHASQGNSAKKVEQGTKGPKQRNRHEPILETARMGQSITVRGSNGLVGDSGLQQRPNGSSQPKLPDPSDETGWRQILPIRGPGASAGDQAPHGPLPLPANTDSGTQPNTGTGFGRPELADIVHAVPPKGAPSQPGPSLPDLPGIVDRPDPVVVVPPGPAVDQDDWVDDEFDVDPIPTCDSPNFEGLTPGWFGWFEGMTQYDGSGGFANAADSGVGSCSGTWAYSPVELAGAPGYLSNAEMGGAGFADEPARGPIESAPVDLILTDIRFLDAGSEADETGPRFRITIGNQSEFAVSMPFKLLVIAPDGAAITEQSPHVMVEIQSVAANALTTVEARLPWKNEPPTELEGEGKLVLYVDAEDNIVEVNEQNNVAQILAGDIPDVDLAIAPKENRIAVSGQELILEGEGFGRSPGTIQLEVNGLRQQLPITRWQSLSVAIQLPQLSLNEPLDVKLTVERADGQLSEPVSCQLQPAATR